MHDTYTSAHTGAITSQQNTNLQLVTNTIFRITKESKDKQMRKNRDWKKKEEN